MTTTTTSAPRRSAARTRALVLAALAEATEPVTVTELAEKVGVGTSTLAKHLPALEKDGLAVRTPGGREGRRRLPDTWQAATSTTPDTAPDRDAVPQEDHQAQGNTVPDSQAQTPEVDTPDRAPVTQDTRSQATSDAEQPQTEEEAAAPTSTPDTPPQEATAAPAPPQRTSLPARATTATVTRLGARAAGEANPVSGSPRLAPGELKLMVKAILDTDPGEEFTATAISHLLQGRSIGAIQNNLARLAKEGRAVQTCDRPRRYRSAKHPA
ncbi:ArsR family transcriptional regulator [Nocardiopsis sp. FR6]|uniref:ArsR family transcriptional regulator n=1 Tax=Nocardiopsis sp. FR6 TaxID=2605986 RepID=UPI00135AD78B|nr:ArsR family transcriptional regulator [Nocardiopsis sp. FR6]